MLSVRLPRQLARIDSAELSSGELGWSELNSTSAPVEFMMTTEIAAEAEKLRRVPGIVFVDDTGGRVPKIEGTGLDVWEIVASYKAFGEKEKDLRLAFHWLTHVQLQAALAYYEAFPAEIDARLAREARVMPEAVYARYPFMRPRNGATS